MRRRILMKNMPLGTDRGFYDGYEYIHLGLSGYPSLCMATCNVGAENEWDYGNYYQFGKGAAQYSATSGQSNYNGTESTLPSSADTAAQVMGSLWRMPTNNEITETFRTGGTNSVFSLEYITNYENSGNNVFKFYKKNNPNAYFVIPLAGYYFSTLRNDHINREAYVWSSTNIAYGTSDEKAQAYCLHLHSGYTTISLSDHWYKFIGGSVRGVFNKPSYGVKNGREYVDFGLRSGTLWAKTNIGASDETNVGNYYNWWQASTGQYKVTSGSLYLYIKWKIRRKNAQIRSIKILMAYLIVKFVEYICAINAQSIIKNYSLITK